MFRNTRGGGRDPLLPTSGNGQGGRGGLYGAARRSPKQAISKSFIATMVWALVSASFILGGWHHCNRRMESSSVKCGARDCELTDTKKGVSTVTSILRPNMVRATVVRVKNGVIVNPAGLSRSAQRKLGYSYAIVYVAPDSVDDDDEEYDSFEDDDDSYDSYDDEEDSSEDDDEDINRRAFISNNKNTGTSRTNQKASSTSSKTFTDERRSAGTTAERQAAAKKRADQKNQYVKERRESGLPPIKEPDEQPSQTEKSRQYAVNEDRFPGDAGIMAERLSEEASRVSEGAEMAAQIRAHTETQKTKFQKATDDYHAKTKMHNQAKQMGNNLQDTTKGSPDDPDNYPREKRRPAVEQQESDQQTDPEEQFNTETENRNRGGGRDLSSAGDFEQVRKGKENVAAQEGSQLKEEEVGSIDVGAGDAEEHEDLDLGEKFEMAVGQKGTGRRLLSIKRPTKPETNLPSPSKAQIAQDAAKARNSHREGHGHHQKRQRKFGRVINDDDDGGAPKKAAKPVKHHHKEFHHKKDDPNESHHHLHKAYHRKEEERKIEHGWKHQARQWHGHDEVEKLGTTFSIGRSKARARKGMIDKYIIREKEKAEFTDSKKWRAGGIWMMIVGVISTSFCAAIGNFSSRRGTKAS